jgi:integrase
MASVRKKPNSKFWYACFTMPSGQRMQRSTKTMNKREALKLAEEYEELTRHRITEAQARRVVTDLYRSLSGRELAKTSVRAFLKQWIESRESTVTDSTMSAYRETVAKFNEFLGDRADSDIVYVTTQDFFKFRDYVSENVSSSTANHKFKMIRSAFQQAWREGYIEDNPAARVSPLKVKDKIDRRAFTLGELKRLLAAATGEWEGIILVGVYTGQRLGDIATLTWRNIDLESKTLSLTTGKTGRRQILPLASPLIKWITRQQPNSADSSLFPESHETVLRASGRVGTLSNRFSSIMANAGLIEKQSHRKRASGAGRSGRRAASEITFHSLRHTATSLMKNAGISPAIVQEFVGHDSKAVSQNYTHIDTESLRIAADALPDVTE